VTEAGLVPDATLFYATGGGQPGDTGRILWEGGSATIVNTVKGEDGAIVLVPEVGARPPVGATIRQVLDWDRRHLHMRIHTALHLLSVVLPFPVTGGQIGAGKGRLDFAMDGAPDDPAAVEAQLNELMARDLAVTDDWITDAELRANPGLVKTMSVMPPMGQGRVRLVRIGQGADQIDVQPCGGTHVGRTGEIGPLRLGKIENKASRTAG
jgi:misacylated tRNA(Ala) deacylase